jgi:hypothetical protein
MCLMNCAPKNIRAMPCSEYLYTYFLQEPPFYQHDMLCHSLHSEVQVELGQGPDS